MAFLSTIDIIGSGFTAQQLRLDVISENVTNMNTTRTAEGGTVTDLNISKFLKYNPNQCI